MCGGASGNWRGWIRAARLDNRVPGVMFLTRVPHPLRLRCNRGSLLPRGRVMTILASRIDPAAPEFRANAARMRALVAELEQRRAEAAAGGSEKARERHLARGKLLPRDRVMTLIDAGSPLLELSPLAANGMYEIGRAHV